MRDETSPFTPGVPVPVEFFVGRAEQVRRLLDMWTESGHARVPRVAFVTGDRGIGKSSLAAFVRSLLARRGGQIASHVYLGSVTSLPDMARKVWEQMLNDSAERPWHRKLLGLLGNRVTQVGLFGVTLQLQLNQAEMEGLPYRFVRELRNLLKQLGEPSAAPVLILDDINGLAESAAFANWLKSAVDEAATASERLPLLLILVGLPERRQALLRLQPSLGRLLEVVQIDPWSPEEAGDFFQRAFQRVNRGVSPSALLLMTKFSGGYPMLAHEIGDAVFRADRDGTIDAEDAYLGIQQAAEVVGRKLLQPQVFQAIHSPLYLSTLRKAARLGFHFTLQELRSRLSSAEARALGNFVVRMKRLGVIVPGQGEGRGSYRFANRLHHLYFQMEASNAEKLDAVLEGLQMEQGTLGEARGS